MRETKILAAISALIATFTISSSLVLGQSIDPIKLSEFRATAPALPEVRYFHAMAYSDKLKRTVLFGGEHFPAMLDDTWFWNGKTWKQNAAKGPGPENNMPWPTTAPEK